MNRISNSNRLDSLLRLPEPEAAFHNNCFLTTSCPCVPYAPSWREKCLVWFWSANIEQDSHPPPAIPPALARSQAAAGAVRSRWAALPARGNATGALVTAAPVPVPAPADIFQGLLPGLWTKHLLFSWGKGHAQLLQTPLRMATRAETKGQVQAKQTGTCPPGFEFVLALS